MTQIEQILLNRVKLIEDDSWSLLGSPNSLIKELEAIITAQINQAKIEAQKEILAFATRVQANGQYIPIEVGLIPWLETQLSNTHKEQL